jgi:hypothetical protein
LIVSGGGINMKCFVVSRIDKIMYYEDMDMAVIAKDEMWAEKLARLRSKDFRKAKLKVREIDLSKEQVILITHRGA